MPTPEALNERQRNFLSKVSERLLQSQGIGATSSRQFKAARSVLTDALADRFERTVRHLVQSGVLTLEGDI